MERSSLGYRWADGQSHQPSVTPRKRRWSTVVATLLALMTMAATALAADDLSADGDALTANAQSKNVAVSLAAGASTTKTIGAYIDSGGGSNHVAFPVNATAAVSQDVNGIVTSGPTPGSGQITNYGTANEFATQVMITAPGNDDLACGVDNVFTAKVQFAGTSDANSTPIPSNELNQGNDAAVTFTLTVAGPACQPANAAPTSVNASFGGSVDCRAAATLTATFSDPDSNSWSLAIDWDYEGTTFTTDQTVSPYSSGAGVSHTYNSPGPYTAAVKVTDGEGATSAIATATITVTQEYSMQYLEPFTHSTAGAFVINSAKAGRVVPVKVRIFDVCAQQAYESPSTAPTVGVAKTTAPNGSDVDPLEAYVADAAGASNDGSSFRWADGFWIYNLDTKALSLQTGQTYRVDVFVSSVKASDDEFGLLKTVK